MTTPTPAQLHHLANRARDGVALDAEHDQLAAGITAMAARLDRANKAIRFMLQQDADAAATAVRAIQLMNEAGAQRDQAEELLRVAHETSNRSEAERARVVTRAEQAEAAIERVRLLADRWDNALAPDQRYARALRAALDQAQQPTT